MEAIDNSNGSVTLRWAQFPSGPAPDSYNVYVNGVLNQNVVTRTATVTALQQSAYNPATQTVTPSGKYAFKVVAVKAGLEVAALPDVLVTVSPTSVMLVTPMRRPFPFPNSGLE